MDGRVLTMKHGSVTTYWADGEHTFRLAIGQMRELQEKVGVGPYKVLERLRDNDWRVDEIREVIRLGLIGGGMSPAEAYRLIVRYFDEYETPLLDHIPAAMSVLIAPMMGTPEPAGKSKAGKSKRKPRQTRSAGSTSPASTTTEAFSAGL